MYYWNLYKIHDTQQDANSQQSEPQINSLPIELRLQYLNYNK